MSENLQSIKELAEELGVTKQNIQYHYQRLPKDLQIKSNKGANIVTPKARKIILSKVEKSNKEFATKDQQTSSKDQKEENSSKNEEVLLKRLIDEIEYLKNDKDKIILAKDQQISIKDQQIEKLTNLLDQQQQLALQDKNLLEEYKSEIKSLKSLSISGDRTEIQKKEAFESEDDANVQEQPKKWWHLWR